MNWTLSDYANLAQIVSIPLTIALWLFTKDHFANFWKKYLKYIVGLLVLIVAYSIWKKWGRNWIFSPVATLLANPITIPVWFILLLIPLVALIALLAWLIAGSRRKISLHRRQEMPPNQPAVQTATHSSKPAEPVRIDWHNYIQDEIFGVLWQWGYSNNSINERALGAFCPRAGCMNRLRVEFDPTNPSLHNNFHVPPETLICHRCGFKRHLEFDGGTFHVRVCDEIERRVRTGEYVQRIKNAVIS